MGVGCGGVGMGARGVVSNSDKSSTKEDCSVAGGREFLQ